MNKVISILFFLIPFLSISQTDIVASGGNAIGSGGSVSYSVGQNVFSTYSGNGGFISQGVQHQYEVSNLGVGNNLIQLSIIAYPNPTRDFLTLKIENSNNEKFDYQLFNINGTVVAGGKIESDKAIIWMDEFPTAIYLLKITSENKAFNTFKIIKR